jgi:SET domain-containing protein
MKRYRKRDWKDPRIEIRSSPLHGKGMFAIAPIEKGEVVVIWGLHPTYSSKEDAERAAAYGRAEGKSTIVQQLDENLFVVDDRKKPVPSDFINHSCDPNIWFEDEATLTTRRNIKPNEELTLDYACGIDCEDFVAPWECVCGSPLCRRRITGKDWRIPQLQEKYAGHFTPLVSKWIARLKEQKARVSRDDYKKNH